MTDKALEFHGFRFKVVGDGVVEAYGRKYGRRELRSYALKQSRGRMLPALFVAEKVMGFMERCAWWRDRALAESPVWSNWEVGVKETHRLARSFQRVDGGADIAEWARDVYQATWRDIIDNACPAVSRDVKAIMKAFKPEQDEEVVSLEKSNTGDRGGSDAAGEPEADSAD